MSSLPMNSYSQPDVLPIHEFPEGTLLLRDWKSIYLETILGRVTLPRRYDLGSLISRMHHLHVSKIRWYSTNVPLELNSERLRTFELASGSQWDASPALQPRGSATTVQDPGSGGAGSYHQHHYLIAEISLPIQDPLGITPGASTTSSVSAQLPPPSSSALARTVLGYLRIDGTCRSDSFAPSAVLDSVSASRGRSQTLSDSLVHSGNPASTQTQQPPHRPQFAWGNRRGHDLHDHATSLTSELLQARLLNATLGSEGSSVSTLLPPSGGRSGSRDGLLSLPLVPHTPPRPLSDLVIPSSQEAWTGDDVATPSTSRDVDATPVTRRYRRSLIQPTPTQAHPYDDEEEPQGASSHQHGPFSLGEDNDTLSPSSRPRGSSSGGPPAPTGTEGTSSLGSPSFDPPYLDKATSPSPLFISPFASRSNSATRSRASTDTTRSQTGTRPSSRSNSSSNSHSLSNATSFTTSSSFSLSSAGLVFSDNPLAHLDSSRLSRESARFIIMYLEEARAIEETQATENDECVLELSFPVAQSATPAEANDSPQSFFTLRDLAILADLIERSLKEEQRSDLEMEARDLSISDSASDSAASDASENSTGPSEMSLFASSDSTCCCEFFKRLVNLIPLVSGLRVVGGSGTSMFLPGGERADASLHYDAFSHHGRHLRTPFGEDGRSGGRDGYPSPVLLAELKAKFERRRARYDRELLSEARSVDHPGRATEAKSGQTWTSQSGSSTSVLVQGSTDLNNSVPALALEEARIATETFLRAVREVEEIVRSSTGSPSSDDEL